MKPKFELMEIPIADLKTLFFMRDHLDQDWVLHLALLYESGVKIKPIEVRRNGAGFEVFDGRSRLSAQDLLGRYRVWCEVYDLTEKEALCRALTNNMDTNAPLQMKKKDIVHSVVLLLDNGLNTVEIRGHLPFNSKACSRYLKDAAALRFNRKLSRALSMMENGVKLREASRAVDIEPEKVAKALKTMREKVAGLPQVKGTLTKNFRAWGQALCSRFRRLREAFECGECTEKQLEDVFIHTFTLIDKLTGRVKEEHRRFLALVPKEKK